MSGLGNIAEKMAMQASAFLSEQKRAAGGRLARGGKFTARVSVSAGQCQAFQAGALGNFPFYWQDPTNLKFNKKTYEWISAGLRANASPVQLAQPFTNLYISALSKVNYNLSSSDAAQLAQVQQEVLARQAALLKAWQSAFGEIPQRTGNMEPIDVVIYRITQTWAVPPITLQQLQGAQDLRAELNRMPPSGISVLPALAGYLDALQSNSSLINQVTMNRVYLQQALAAVQSPSSASGAIETNDGLLRPAYFVSTPLQRILDSLNSTDTNKTLIYRMTAARDTPTECSVAVNHAASDKVQIEDFLSIETDDGMDLFKDLIIPDREKADIELTFTGVTTVNFGPADFSMAEMKNWYWMSPINDAIVNSGKDVSGFRFSPVSQIDFGYTGPFGFLTGVTISKNASLKITSSRDTSQAIAQAAKASPSVRVKFLTTPISTNSNRSLEHGVSVASQAHDAPTVINLAAMPDRAGDSPDSTAFVICVHTDYPSADLTSAVDQ
jgi:hypothetical protein